MAAPVLLEGAHPALVDLADGRGVQRVHALAAFVARVHQLGFAQYVEMFHHAETAETREALHAPRGGTRPVAQRVEEGAARWIGERLPYRVELVRVGDGR